MVILFFIDGLGAGVDDPAINPLARSRGLLSHFADGSSAAELPSGAHLQLIDANLGVEGRPQSATGQSTLLTGRNCAALLGGHLTGFPNRRLRAELEDDNLFQRLAARGLRPAFLNAYHSGYLAALGLPHRPQRRVPARTLELPRHLSRPASTTVAAVAAGLELANLDAVLEGTALYHDFTGVWGQARGLTTPALTPAAAGRQLVSAARRWDFSLFEYFLTDEVGHARDWHAARDRLAELEAFLQAALGELDSGRDTLFVVSDHGNLEDLQTRSHTRNPVPFLAFGQRADAAADARSLVDVAGVLERVTAP